MELFMSQDQATLVVAVPSPDGPGGCLLALAGSNVRPYQGVYDERGPLAALQFQYPEEGYSEAGFHALEMVGV